MKGDGLLLHTQGCDALGNGAEEFVEGALHEGGVPDHHLHLRQHILPNAGRGDQHRGTDLSHILLHRFRTLGAIDTHASQLGHDH